MKNRLISLLILCSFYFLTGCEYLNRREFCDCMDMGQAFEDAFKLSKIEREEKAKGCQWIEEELSTIEFIEEAKKCTNGK